MLHVLKIVAVVLTLSSSHAMAGGTVILMRHAIAPGIGDPAHFQIDDCETQRNLSAEGIAQAQEIGEALAAKGLQPTRILTSPWCRCIDTAKALNLGAFEIHQGLASFYEGHVDKDKTLALLRQELERIDEDELVLFVTHQVVIQAVTGVFVKSGGYIIADSSQFE